MNIIYILSEYRWLKAELLATNVKTLKVSFQVPGCVPQIKLVSKDKCASPDEIVCVVWETWRGVNGRGGYRVEREKYPNQRLPAKQIAACHATDAPGRVSE